MRILHVIHSVDPKTGGPVEGIRQLAAAMAGYGIETEVMSLDAPGAPGTSDFPVPLHTTGPSSLGYGYNPRAVPWLKEHGEKYDAIIVNGLWQYGGLAVWRALRKTDTPYYVYPHGMLDPWFKRKYPLKHLKKWFYWLWAEYRVLHDAAAVLFTSEQERIDARQSFWLYSCREEVTGYGIATPVIDLPRQRAKFLEQFPELKGKRLILFLGRVHEKKGCDLLLRAWKQAASSTSATPNALEPHLVMAGPTDHPYGIEMKELAKQLGLEQQVTWTGMITGDLKWGSLGVAEAFILPSHQENFGISVVEALACGVPVLISNKINIWSKISEDNAGLVENDDLPGTVSLLQRWFGLSQAQKEEMHSHARSCFTQHFNIAGTATALIMILRRKEHVFMTSRTCTQY